MLEDHSRGAARFWDLQGRNNLGEVTVARSTHQQAQVQILAALLFITEPRATTMALEAISALAGGGNQRHTAAAALAHHDQLREIPGWPFVEHQVLTVACCTLFRRSMHEVDPRELFEVPPNTSHHEAHGHEVASALLVHVAVVSLFGGGAASNQGSTLRVLAHEPGREFEHLDPTLAAWFLLVTSRRYHERLIIAQSWKLPL